MPDSRQAAAVPADRDAATYISGFGRVAWSISGNSRLPNN
jgi:hypothetical protein